MNGLWSLQHFSLGTGYISVGMNLDGRLESFHGGSSGVGISEHRWQWAPGWW
jgi:hypothetical protein